jgi:micrococcal nuclease
LNVFAIRQWASRFASALGLLGIGLISIPTLASEPHGSAEAPLPGYVYGRVVGIADGDTLTLLTPEKTQARIRLAEIDTPEGGQPYASKAQDELSGLVWQKNIAVRVQTTDRYGRLARRIYVGNIDVSAEMVRRGVAWVYRKYAKDQVLFKLESEARYAQRGIWGLSETERVPPWEWRRRR